MDRSRGVALHYRSMLFHIVVLDAVVMLSAHMLLLI
jgi:hypothetical protein